MKGKQEFVDKGEWPSPFTTKSLYGINYFEEVEVESLLFRPRDHGSVSFCVPVSFL